MKRKIIKSITELKKLAKNKQVDVAIILAGGGLLSRKNITWYPEDKKFGVFHGIDGTMEYLTEKQLLNDNWTNIGLAIKKKALILEIF